MIANPPAPPMPAGVDQGAQLRRVVLGSRAPHRAAAWYRRALGLPVADPPPHAGGETLQAGDVELVINHRTHLADAAVDPNRLVLNFLVENILEVEARLVAMGAIWIRELERVPWGIIGTVLDVDGNYVQVIEPTRGSVPWLAKGTEEHP